MAAPSFSPATDCFVDYDAETGLGICRSCDWSGIPNQREGYIMCPSCQGDVYPEPVPKVGRNDPCPCGSGKKFKKCCG